MWMEPLEQRQMFAAATGLVLVNADTNQDIMALGPTVTINLATLPTRNLNVRADATSDTKSVRFDYDSQIGYRTESVRPFALAADTKGDYNAWTPLVGTHKIVASGFAATAGQGGSAGNVQTTLTVIDQPAGDPGTVAALITKLALYNTDTQKQIAVLDGTNKTIDLAPFGTKNVTIRATTSGTLQSVQWGVNVTPKFTVANASPYSLAGKDASGAFAKANVLTNGTFTITATPFSKDNAGGSAGTALTVKFTLINGDPKQPDPPPPGNGAPVNPPIAGNWNSIFVDDFNALPDPNMWTPSLWGTTVGGSDDLEAYSRSALSVSNGILTMTASKAPLSGKPYTSARISTGGTGVAPTFAFKYGYVEARLKLPAGNGTFPAFWMLPATYNFEYDDSRGELDIMEHIGREPTKTYAFDHRGPDGTHWGKGLSTGVDLSQGFHTYGLDWAADHLTWYFDGKPFFTLTDPAAIPVVAEYLILNIAIGAPGSWPGTPDSTTVFPTSMQVDYVKVWQKG